MLAYTSVAELRLHLDVAGKIAGGLPLGHHRIVSTARAAAISGAGLAAPAACRAPPPAPMPRAAGRRRRTMTTPSMESEQIRKAIAWATSSAGRCARPASWRRTGRRASSSAPGAGGPPRRVDEARGDAVDAQRPQLGDGVGTRAATAALAAPIPDVPGTAAWAETAATNTMLPSLRRWGIAAWAQAKCGKTFSSNPSRMSARSIVAKGPRPLELPSARSEMVERPDLREGPLHAPAVGGIDHHRRDIAAERLPRRLQSGARCGRRWSRRGRAP